MKSWKTTLAGYIPAVILAVETILKDEKIDWWKVLLAVAIAILGHLAKDFDTTGKP